MAQIDRTRAVIENDETYDGTVMPTVQAELGRSVRVDNGATVQGSIYGEDVELSAESEVLESIMASGAVEILGGHVHSEVGTPGKVVGEDARVDGTITGKRIRLSDSVVRGNVVGAEVILENCIVLGIVTADRQLSLKRTLCYTFRGHGELSISDSTVILPQAVANGTLHLETPVQVAGLGSCEVSEDDSGSRLPQMTGEDVYEQADMTYLTLAPRILNLEKVTDRLDELERSVMSVVNDLGNDGEAELSVSDVLELLDVEDLPETRLE